MFSTSRTLTFLSLIFVAFACEEASRPSAAEEVATAPQSVTAVGQNYCLGCALKKEQGAAAQCSVYGHRHALKIESASAADGRPLKGLAGQTLHYLDNDQSATLIKGDELHGKRVEVTGRLFPAEQTLEVSAVKAL